MADVTTAAAATTNESAPNEAAAARTVERFRALSTETRGCAILGSGDHSLAASGERKAWADAAATLLKAADRAAGGRCVQAHVATEDGEAYAVRFGGLAMVAVTDRFTLSSLVICDMRAALRSLTRGADDFATTSGANAEAATAPADAAREPSESQMRAA